MRVKPCNQLTVGGPQNPEIEFMDVFFFHFSAYSILLVLLFPSSRESDVGWGDKLNGQLASCVRNIHTVSKILKLDNSRTLIDNAEDVFFETVTLRQKVIMS